MLTGRRSFTVGLGALLWMPAGGAYGMGDSDGKGTPPSVTVVGPPLISEFERKPRVAFGP